MRIDPQFPPEIIHYLERLMLRLCRCWKVPIYEVLAGGQRNAAPLPTVRAILVRTIRRTIMYRDIRIGRAVRHEYKRVVDSGLVNNREGGWRPLSTTRVGWVVNLDHSEVVLILRRERE